MKSVGLDVHKVNTQVCILGEQGEVEGERRIGTERKYLAKLFAEGERMRILIEASTESEWVARFLEELGHEVIVADPNYAPMYPHRTRRVKTDRRDARALAQACRSGVWRRAHRCSETQRQRRRQLSVRETLVRTRTRYISVIRSLLRAEGLRVRSGDASTFTRRVEELEVPAALANTITPLLDLTRELTQRLVSIDRELGQTARTDPTVRRLCTAPAVGAVTAMAFMAAVDDIGRFHKAHHLESYLGLVPGERSSGEHRHRGHLTKHGTARPRWLLVEAGWTLLRGKAANAQSLCAWGRRIAARRGKSIAAVALARRLAGILFAMWRNHTDFDPGMIRLPKGKLQAA